MEMRAFLLVSCSALLCSAIFLEFCEAARIDEASDGFNNAVESVAETEKRMKKLVNSGVKMALPFMMSTVTEIKLTPSCMRGLMKLMRGVMDIKDWAIRMVDALGKPSAGILEGTATAMGDYDECLEIMVPKNTRSAPRPPFTQDEIDYQGQFCVVQIDIPEGIRQAAMAYQAGNRSNLELTNSKTFLRNLVMKIAPRADVADLRLGVCLPSTCQMEDLQNIVDEIASMVNFKATAMRCEIKEKKILKLEHIIMLSLIGLAVALIIAGTLAELIFRFKQSEPVDDIFMEKRGLGIQALLAFSVTRNVRKLVSIIPNDTPKTSCVRGMKFISVCLYVVVWTYARPQDFHFLKYRSAFHFHKFMEEWWFTVFANASAGIDTLFVIAGLQVTYRLWNKCKGSQVSVNIPKFIIKWYSRFMLSQLIVIGLFLCLPLIGNGPIWADVVTPVINNCRERWWLNALAINNFWSSSVTCLPHTWLICSLMHMLFLAPILLFILSKWTSVGIFVNIILILGSSVAIAMVTLMKDLPPAPAFYFLSFINIETMWDKLFIQAYDHIGPFSVGMLLGYFLNHYSRVEMRKITVFVGWCAAIACNLAVMCGLYGYRHGESMEITLAALYASVHRIGWSLGIAWIIFACAYGYGGFVNTILSWKIFIPFERITNLIYLLHPLILFLHEGQLREKLYMAHLDQAMYATAYIVFTIVIAALCYIMCLAPFMFFERKIWTYFPNSMFKKGISEIEAAEGKKGKLTTVDIYRHKENIDHLQHTIATTKTGDITSKT